MKVQRPSTADNWLYKEIKGDRWFTKEACLPNNAPELPECTNEEKEEWEKEHRPEPAPEESDVE